jgi:hypothetical protein
MFEDLKTILCYAGICILFGGIVIGLGVGLGVYYGTK